MQSQEKLHNTLYKVRGALLFNYLVHFSVVGMLQGICMLWGIKNKGHYKQNVCWSKWTGKTRETTHSCAHTCTCCRHTQSPHQKYLIKYTDITQILFRQNNYIIEWYLLTTVSYFCGKARSKEGWGSLKHRRLSLINRLALHSVGAVTHHHLLKNKMLLQVGKQRSTLATKVATNLATKFSLKKK